MISKYSAIVALTVTHSAAPKSVRQAGVKDVTTQRVGPTRAAITANHKNASRWGSERSPRNVAGSRVAKAIRQLVKKVDIVVLSVHYGMEFVHVPMDRTIRIYHDFVDAGADLILGHHPHVLRGVEQYKRALILHSLGNYTFASKTVRHRAVGAKLYGLIAEIRISRKRIVRVVLHPRYVNNLEKWTLGDQTIRAANFVPYPVKGKFARAVLDAVQQWSTAIPGNKVKIRFQGDRGVIRLR